MKLEIENNSSQKLVIKMEGKDYDLSSPFLKSEIDKLFDLYGVYKSQKKLGNKEQVSRIYQKMFGVVTKVLKVEGEVEIIFSDQSILSINLLESKLNIIEVDKEIDSEGRKIIEYYSKEKNHILLMALVAEYHVKYQSIIDESFSNDLTNMENERRKVIKNGEYGKAAKIQSNIKDYLKAKSPFDESHSIVVHFKSGVDWYIVYFEI